jgi:hypothetical protein
VSIGSIPAIMVAWLPWEHLARLGLYCLGGRSKAVERSNEAESVHGRGKRREGYTAITKTNGLAGWAASYHENLRMPLGMLGDGEVSE